MTADGQGYSIDEEPLTFHKYFYTECDPVNGSDPSGHEDLIEIQGEEVVDKALGGAGAEAVAAVATTGRTGISTFQVFQRLLLGLSASTAATAFTHYLLNPGPVVAAVQTAVQTALKYTTLTQQQIYSLPIFWVYQSGQFATPAIWKNDAAAIARVGSWVVLNYFGQNVALKNANRAVAKARAATLGIVARQGVTSIDEYPYATTREGGGVATLAPEVDAVPVKEQSRQGGP